MGHYSRLFIDDYSLSWKYYVPNYLAFFFTEDDFYKNKIEENEDEYWFEYGYKTNVQKALNTLNDNGYTKNLFIEVYNFFYEDLLLENELWIKESIFEYYYDWKSENNKENKKDNLLNDLID